MRRSRPLTVASIVALTVIALGGCGDGEDQRTGGQEGAVQRVRVVETEFRLAPADVTVRRAGKLTIEVVNRGRSVHALAIETPEGEVESGRVRPGASRRLEASLDAGTFTWYCPVGDHRELGMRGRIRVGQAEAQPGRRPDPPSSPGY